MPSDYAKDYSMPIRLSPKGPTGSVGGTSKPSERKPTDALRPRAAWPTVLAAEAGISAAGLTALHYLAPERLMHELMLGWFLVCALVLCVCAVWALQDRRRHKEALAAEAERAAKTEVAEAERAAKAEAAEAERAAKAEAAEAERAFKRSTTACIKCSERLPKWFVSRFKELGGNICLRCETGGFEPYPESDQTEDDYVTKRKGRHAVLPPGAPPKKEDEP